MPFKNSDNIDAFLSCIARPVSNSFQAREPIHRRYIPRIPDTGSSDAETTIIFSKGDVITTRERSNGPTHGVLWYVSTEAAIQRWGGLTVTPDDPHVMTNLAPPTQTFQHLHTTSRTAPPSNELTNKKPLVTSTPTKCISIVKVQKRPSYFRYNSAPT